MFRIPDYRIRAECSLWTILATFLPSKRLLFCSGPSQHSLSTLPLRELHVRDYLLCMCSGMQNDWGKALRCVLFSPARLTSSRRASDFSLTTTACGVAARLRMFSSSHLSMRALSYLTCWRYEVRVVPSIWTVRLNLPKIARRSSVVPRFPRLGTLGGVLLQPMGLYPSNAEL